MDKRIRKHVYRGTRPKYSLANSRKVYCDRCECSYDIPVSRNGDQWLNYHWAHFNCIQKTIIRQQEENDDFTLRKPAVSDALKTDKHFVIDGAREERRQTLDEQVSDDGSVDSATNFEMPGPDCHDVADEETYEDYNESWNGFFATPMSAEDVGQSYHPNRTDPGEFGTIHLEEISKSGCREIPSVDIAQPTFLLSEIQSHIIQTLDVDNEREDFIIRSRSRLDKYTGKKLLADVVDLYDWGLRLGVYARKRLLK